LWSPCRFLKSDNLLGTQTEGEVSRNRPSVVEDRERVLEKRGALRSGGGDGRGKKETSYLGDRNNEELRLRHIWKRR